MVLFLACGKKERLLSTTVLLNFSDIFWVPCFKTASMYDSCSMCPQSRMISLINEFNKQIKFICITWIELNRAKIRTAPLSKPLWRKPAYEMCTRMWKKQVKMHMLYEGSLQWWLLFISYLCNGAYAVICSTL